ncbi:transketolase subunit A [Jatrophihabitans endophyticus]|uniref:Transketolase subunit A n=1 Tax=Jatrophihabitans endophyticus TaxID=1206085 RepID=A0A1M5CRI5_9ACTN|nr:transketolase [Jatrophihabitans endophyticus]SHF56932.1 transketolase subunit A [Jatrophihabitans endophyticus]
MNAASVDTRELAERIRHHVVDMCGTGLGGHLGGGLSIADILAVLYGQVLAVRPDQPDWPERDRFILSKGHGALGLYAVLALRGFLPVEELGTLGRAGSRLGGHPTRRVPGVEFATGSLGHGIALGLGTALAARLAGGPSRTVVLVGDGELQEGSCWEAAAAAAAVGADTLTVVVDANGLQLGRAVPGPGRPGDLADRWHASGWDVQQVDGHDHDSLAAALTAPTTPQQPRAIVAATAKGYGLPFVAGQVKSHYAALSPRLLARAHGVLDREHDPLARRGTATP